MGLSFIGGPTNEYPAHQVATVTFSASGPSGNLRPRRVWIRARNILGENIQRRVTFPLTFSNSSLARSSGVMASTLASGTMACSRCFAVTGGGGRAIVTTAGRQAWCITNTSGRIRINISQTSLADRNIYLVVQHPNGSRSISSQVRISS